MSHPIESVRVSSAAREQLIRLKRVTGLKNWNVLCRWAFCLSLADSTVPTEHLQGQEGAVEMTWKVFAGEHEELYLALLRQRCRNDAIPLDDKTLVEQLRLHVHRGIAYLAGDRGLAGLPALLARVQHSSS